MMNKSELVKTIAARAGLTQTQAGHALDAFCATVIDELSVGGEVVLAGFGTFKTVVRAERLGRNLKTGEAMTIEAQMVAKFTASKALKEAVKLIV
nr:HU family DNA-binding protein [Kingella kingae]